MNPIRHLRNKPKMPEKFNPFPYIGIGLLGLMTTRIIYVEYKNWNN